MLDKLPILLKVKHCNKLTLSNATAAKAIVIYVSCLETHHP
jgi:hypothetical protein